MKDNRPVNLDFTTFRLPLPALTSFVHRVSGAFLFFGIAFLLYLLDTSLQSPDGFARVETMLDGALMKLGVWIVVSALLYHLVAGIKHLLMDLGIGETMAGGVLASRLVIVFSAIAIIIAGIWIW